MNTEVAVSKPGGALATQSRGTFQGDATDILVPRLYAAQKTSKVVDDNLAKPGQLLRSTTNEILGGLGKPIPIIPLKHWKSWMVTEGGKFVELIPWKPENANLPFEFDFKGKQRRNERMLNFFILLPKDVEAYLAARKQLQETGEMPDKVVGLTPLQIGFKSTSYKAGRALVTHFAQMEDLGAFPYMRWLTLDSEIQKNDKGSFAVLKITDGGAVKDKEVKDAAERWYGIVKGKEMRVDDSGLDDEAVDAMSVSVDAKVEF